MPRAKIVGIEAVEFNGRDGTPVKGVTIHTSEDLDPKRGQGVRVEHYFMSDAKLANLTFRPAVGQNVNVYFTRYGKVDTVCLVDDDDSIIV